MASKRNEERLRKIEERVGLLKEPLNILFVSFIDSNGRRCKALPSIQYLLGRVNQ